MPWCPTRVAPRSSPRSRALRDSVHRRWQTQPLPGRRAQTDAGCDRAGAKAAASPTKTGTDRIGHAPGLPNPGRRERPRSIPGSRREKRRTTSQGTRDRRVPGNTPASRSRSATTTHGSIPTTPAGRRARCASSNGSSSVTTTRKKSTATAPSLGFRISASNPSSTWRPLGERLANRLPGPSRNRVFSDHSIAANIRQRPLYERSMHLACDLERALAHAFDPLASCQAPTSEGSTTLQVEPEGFGGPLIELLHHVLVFREPL
jgi:hypothetical protein